MSDGERWPQVSDILAQVLDLPESERDAFIAEACAGDDALRRRVDDLLRAHDAGDSFLAGPAVVAPRPDETQAEGTTADESPLPPLEPSDRPGALGRLGH